MAATARPAPIECSKGALPSDLLDGRGQEVALEEEDPVLDEHREGGPVRLLGPAACCRDTAGCPVAEGQAGRDDCDDAGRVHLLGQEERDEGDDEGDGDVEDERGRVVDQALALEDGDDPPGQAEPLAETDRGDPVGGRDDGPDGEGERERYRGERRVDDEARRGRRERDENDRERGDDPKVAPEVDEGHLEGRRVEQRGEDDAEDDVGVDLDERRRRDG